jgi:hypothetical protein
MPELGDELQLELGPQQFDHPKTPAPPPLSNKAALESLVDGLTGGSKDTRQPTKRKVARARSSLDLGSGEGFHITMDLTEVVDEPSTLGRPVDKRPPDLEQRLAALETGLAKNQLTIQLLVNHLVRRDLLTRDEVQRLMGDIADDS